MDEDEKEDDRKLPTLIGTVEITDAWVCICYSGTNQASYFQMRTRSLSDVLKDIQQRRRIHAFLRDRIQD